MITLVFFGTCAALLGVAYAAYELRGLNRHPQDVQLFDLRRMAGPFGRVILADSVTENATAGIAFDVNSLPLMTHGWMRLAGQYLMLRRVLERGSVQALDLFLVPEMLATDVDDEGQGRIRHTYTDTLFTRSDEVAELKRAGDHRAGTQVVLFELVYKSLQPGARSLPQRSVLWKPAARPGASTVGDEAGRRISLRARMLDPLRITPQNAYFLNRFSQTCRERGMACRFIIEPMPASLPPFDAAELRRLAPGIAVINANDLASFPDHAFRDGLHLKGPDWEAYYQTLLATNGLADFADSLPLATLPVWDGTRMPLGRGATPEPAMFGGFHDAEAWGRWTKGTQAQVTFRIDPQAMRKAALLVEVTGLVRHGPQQVRVLLNDVLLCTSELYMDGDAVIPCWLPDDAKAEITLRFEISYSSSPTEWGEGDARNLGLGLRALSLHPGH